MRRAIAAGLLAVVVLGCSDDDAPRGGATSQPSSTTAEPASAPPALEDRSIGGSPEALVLAAGEEPPARSQALQVLGARSSDAHDALLLHVLGAFEDQDPCGTYSSPSATVDGAVVTVRAVARRPPEGCGVGYSTGTVWVRTPSLAGEASLIDGATGAPVPITDGVALVRPIGLPDGWRFVAERGQDLEWEQFYAFGGEADQVRFVVHQGVEIDQLAPIRAWRTVRRITLGGHPAELIGQGQGSIQQLGVTWKQGSDDVLAYLAAPDPAAGPTNEALLLDLAARLAPARAGP